MAVKVPDRAKVKGAGTSAIVDLVGFREDNVLPVAAFYGRGDTTVNYLAEVKCPLLCADEDSFVMHAHTACCGCVLSGCGMYLSDQWLLNVPLFCLPHPVDNRSKRIGAGGDNRDAE